jgi:trans-2,3-dihydro-3-hydroxyanthranilate isomerase
MTDYRYLHLDVFTDRPFEGNQLAVFPQATALEPAVMQQIAREMNFSESTFILPPEGTGDIRMRIFTPAEELPMAGHPTIGSTFALAHEGVIERARDVFTFELGVGPTPVQLEWEEDRLSFAWMTQKNPAFGPILDDAGELARALHVDADQVAEYPLQEVSCGVPFFFLVLKTRKAIDLAEPDRLAITRFFGDRKLQIHGLFLFTPEGGSDEATVYSRMFAPSLGIAEDPATGAASGPLGCYCLEHGIIEPDRAREFVSLQGVKMGRRSRIHISVEQSRRELASEEKTSTANIIRVRVGGIAVLVGEGKLTI